MTRLIKLCEYAILNAKWLLFPGMNLHTRLRNRIIPRFLTPAANGQSHHVLDAGCGNGMLGHQAYRRGNTVLAVSLKAREVENCRRLFNDFLGIPVSRLRFIYASLYDLELENNSFDEIICTDVLEHLRRDDEICRKFWDWLKPGGSLHLTAPNAEHPYNRTFPLDADEMGGHVRPGYTFASYRELLEPIGFRVATSMGLGGVMRQAFNRRIKQMQEKFGAVAGLPLFFLSLPVALLERRGSPDVPFSVYVRAVKDIAEQ
jgi:SAM-dependent methyltransferase